MTTEKLKMTDSNLVSLPSVSIRSSIYPIAVGALQLWVALLLLVPAIFGRIMPNTPRSQALALSFFTVGYNVLEAVVAIAAAWLSGSNALWGFGLDSHHRVALARGNALAFLEVRSVERILRI